jgi:hypothetical protein
VQFIIDQESFLIPLSALAIPTPLHRDSSADQRPRYRVPEKRTSLNQDVLFPDSDHDLDLEFLDGINSRILEALWDHDERRFLIKAHYPGFHPYLRKFEFSEYFVALSFWEDFTFLYYHRFENLDLKESVKKAKKRRSRLREALKIIRPIKG